ncbi:MAG: MBL fold metallo-hydrolase [Flavobacteriales bacterium]|nr:MBL fold metallo-hydrolase [Flavobacteriales bacterium]MCB9193822.1 MBL fold metallo-hydrolase [Flavobacteriales bacterium]
MVLEFLGTGTSQGIPVIGCRCAVCMSSDPRDKRLRTSAVVHNEGHHVLIDAGPDLRQQLLRADLHALDAVLLTHEHMDHIAGIDELRAFNFIQGRSMDIHASPATLRAVERVFHYAFAKDRYPGVPELDLHEIGAGPFAAGGLRIEPFPVMHYRMPVLGFKMGGLVYITDAKTIAPDVKERITGAEVLVLNALRKQPHVSHFNLAEALAVIDELQPRRAFLTHLSHLMGTHADVSRELPDHVRLAEDGLQVEIPVVGGS